MSLISLHQVSSADSTNQLEPPNPSPGTSGNTAGGLGEVAGAIVAPHLWPSSGGVGLQGGMGQLSHVHHPLPAQLGHAVAPQIHQPGGTVRD